MKTEKDQPGNTGREKRTKEKETERKSKKMKKSGQQKRIRDTG